MLSPKKPKYRKQQKGARRLKGVETRGCELTFGEFGLRATQSGWITSRQIEAARIAITRFIKRGGKVWIKVFPDKPITKKPAETRMGSGKGSTEYWVAEVKKGRLLYELTGVTDKVAQEAFRLAGAKLPVSTAVVARSGNLM